MKSHLQFMIVIENLACIAAAYSDGVAGRVLSEIWRRFDAALPVSDWEREEEPYGLSLRFVGPRFDEARLEELEEVVQSAALTPLTVGKVKLVVALGLSQNEGAATVRYINRNLNIAQYRADMDAAVVAYAALQSGKVRFAEQPIVATDSPEKLLYRERLIRLADAAGGGIAPGAFLPAIERLGLTGAFDRWVIMDTLGELEINPDLLLGCNVSAMSLSADGCWNSCLRGLRAKPDVARRLVIEVTETALPADIGTATDLLFAFKDAGCRIALDDFGSGYSSIAFARVVRPDIIKLDAIFVGETSETIFGSEMLSSLITMSSCMSSLVVVEGVEDAHCLAVAQLAGAQWLQGYHFGRPEIPQDRSPAATPPVRLPNTDRPRRRHVIRQPLAAEETLR
ncbi:EAL domain-containing protein [Rhizobium sp. AG855]|uniref:EAL domain-containing protein n=1 Tax=Rhizobium sp. AG855 TaxID=2183898 RepID=UPI000FF1F73E|nr:EAL domain-containing protein [Rhizobium sp. AG855]RKE79216.1 EAL domain-containing protein (putative c-di-GMP-specific phosphodiesterase class I) [Rhizobium sp. AG855]